MEAAGGIWLGLTVDVSNEDAVSTAAHEVQHTFGSCHILVNNAGIFPNIPFEDMAASDFRRVLKVNLESQFLCAGVSCP